MDTSFASVIFGFVRKDAPNSNARKIVLCSSQWNTMTQEIADHIHNGDSFDMQTDKPCTVSLYLSTLLCC